MANPTYTPMIQQYLTIKEDYADAIVFFRLGDFYEMFFDDAILASKVLDITLTSRHKESNIPMCGVPYHAATLYIQKLIKEGFKVAIAEQTSLPGQGLVERKVTRLITPGTVLDEVILEAGEHNFIGGLYADESSYGLSYLDMSTGQGFVRTCKDLDEVIQIIKKEHILEIVLEQSIPIDIDIIKNTVKLPNHFSSPSNQKLNHHVYKAVLLTLFYVSKTQHHPIDHIKPFEHIDKTSQLLLDERVYKHLEIFESVSGKTLFRVLNQTRTSMGQRYLKHLMMTPTQSMDEILKRQHIISILSQLDMFQPLYDQLDHVYDVYRIIQRFAYQRANPKDMLQLKQSLTHINTLKKYIETHLIALIPLIGHIEDFDHLETTLTHAIKEDAKTNVLEGGFIKEGFDSELDQLNFQYVNHQSWLDAYLEQEKLRTGNKLLKIGYQKTFGYFLEVTKGQIKSISPELGYERKQTLKNTERYTTEALKTHQQEYETLQERMIAREIELYQELQDLILSRYDHLLSTSQVISQIDVFSTLAHFFKTHRYVKPEMTTDIQTDIIDGRHPVIEHYTNFVVNNVSLKQNQMLLITGPNMGGKSTYMRMIALCIYMAHLGLYIPAKQARIALYDAIFTRIGSSDDIASGMSTFMLEMHETNIALQHATNRSLLIFDEIGRGTSTYDGLALAQGILEYIHDEIKCHTLFSTHYHELTSMSLSHAHIKNVHVKAKPSHTDLIFLHQVLEGKSDRSYGVLVASMAHLPDKVIKRSHQILKGLEIQAKIDKTDLFTLGESSENEASQPYALLLERLDNADVNQLKPIEALTFIEELKRLKKLGDTHD